MCLRIPGVPRRAHRRVAAPGAVGEFDQMRLAQRNHARGEQMCGGGCIIGCNAVGTRLRSGSGHPAADMHEVLDRYRQPVQRAARLAGVALAIGGCRRCQRVVAIHLDEGVQVTVERGDAVEIRRDDLARRSRAAHEQLRELGEREPVQVVHDFCRCESIRKRRPALQLPGRMNSGLQLRRCYSSRRRRCEFIRTP